MSFYSVRFLENGEILENIPIIQVPQFFTLEQMQELIKQTINIDTNCILLIKSYFYENTLEFMANKCELSSEDIIEINCVFPSNNDLCIETEDQITSFFFSKENNELIISLLNKKINFYKNNKLEKEKDFPFTVLDVSGQGLFLSASNDLYNEEKIILQNVVKFVGKDKFLTKNSKIIDINGNEIFAPEKEIVEISEINEKFAYLTKKNEIYKDGKSILKINDEIVLSLYFGPNSIICTNKSIYLINEKDEIAKTKKILHFADRSFVNKDFVFVVCHNQICIQHLNDFRVKRIIEVEKQIVKFQVEESLLILASGNKVYFYQI